MKLLQTLFVMALAAILAILFSPLRALVALARIISGPPRRPLFVGRMRTADIAFQGRMGAGFPGDVNRTHPVAIEPCLIDEDDPAEGYGIPVLVDAVTQGVRQFVAGDASANAVRPWGFTVRPYPQQVEAATNYGAQDFGSAIPPVAGIIDVMKLGYIMAVVNGAPVKGGQVYVWCAAAAGAHVQGGLEAAADVGNTAPLENCYFNGIPDAAGVVEVILRD